MWLLSAQLLYKKSNQKEVQVFTKAQYNEVEVFMKTHLWIIFRHPLEWAESINFNTALYFQERHKK